MNKHWVTDILIVWMFVFSELWTNSGWPTSWWCECLYVQNYEHTFGDRHLDRVNVCIFRTMDTRLVTRILDLVNVWIFRTMDTRLVTRILIIWMFVFSELWTHVGWPTSWSCECLYFQNYEHTFGHQDRDLVNVCIFRTMNARTVLSFSMVVILVLEHHTTVSMSRSFHRNMFRGLEKIRKRQHTTPKYPPASEVYSLSWKIHPQIKTWQDRECESTEIDRSITYSTKVYCNTTWRQVSSGTLSPPAERQ